MDFASKTVVELRKIAKEHNVRLPSGINKSDIIQRLEEALGSEDVKDAVQLSMLPASEEKAAAAPETEKADDAENRDDEEPDAGVKSAKPVAPIFSSPRIANQNW